MTPRHIVLFFSVCVIAPFAVGYLLKKAGLVKESLSTRLQLFNIILFTTGTAFLGAWNLDLKWELLFLPATGAMVALAGCAYGLLVGRFHAFSPPQRGSFMLVSSLSNQGYTMGAVVCYAFFGIAGYSLAVVYVSFWQFLLFLLFFPLARHFGGKKAGSVFGAFRQMFTDIRSLPLAGLAGGVTLVASGVPLPAVGKNVLNVLVPLACAVVFFAIGVSVRFRAIRRYLPVYSRAGLWKFGLCPALSALLVKLFHIEGLDAAVILVEGTMPVAVYAVVMSDLFGLDRDMANSAFIVTTVLFMAVILPVLAVTVAA